MSGYSKLFSEIVTSSIWSEDDKTRIVWITLLALKDKDGYVPASVPGLANAARVSVEACAEAIAKLEAPDKYSRSKENNGRRIEPVDGGWTVLNHQKYRDYLSKDSENIAARERMRRMRERNKGVTPETPVKHDVIDGQEVSLTPESSPPTIPPDPSVVGLVIDVQTCNPAFLGLNKMAIENVLKDVPLEVAKKAVDEFCKNYANAIKVPDLPLRMLAGYLRKAYDAEQPRKPRSRLT